MGTSSSYGGPSGTGALLPPWAPALDGQEQPAPPTEESAGTPDSPSPQTPTRQPLNGQPTWSAAKGSLSRYGSSGGTGNRGGRKYLRSAGRGFVRAQGGSRKAARAARAGISTAQGIGGFLDTLASRGSVEAARLYRLDNFLGRSADSLLTAIVDQVAPAGAQLEEAAARAAAVETLAELFAERGVDATGLAALDGLGIDDIRAAMGKFLCRYIFERLIQVLGKKLENRPAADVVRLEAGVKSYLEGSVRLDLSGINVGSMDWKGTAGQTLITRLYEEAYGLIESQ